MNNNNNNNNNRNEQNTYINIYYNITQYFSYIL